MILIICCMMSTIINLILEIDTWIWRKWMARELDKYAAEQVRKYERDHRNR